MTVIVTDSTCDLSAQEQARLNIKVLPLLVNFEDGSFRDGVDMTAEEFCRRLRECRKPPTTSQVNPSDFEAIFRPCIERGDDVVGIFLSSGVSGTYQSAVVAREAVGSPNIHLIDSRNATIAEALLVRIACALRDEGLPVGQIVQKITALVPRTRLFVIVETLKFLRMGGRLSATSAVVGDMLGIMPIIKLVDGKAEAAGKARGKKNAYEFVLRQMELDPPDDAYPKAVGHVDASEKIPGFTKTLEPFIDGDNVAVAQIGSVIGTHVGPGSVAVAYIAK